MSAVLMAQLYPLATGIAINGVLSKQYLMIGWLIACHLLMVIFEVSAKMADTRVFNAIYSRSAAELVEASREQEMAAARVAARTSLLKEYITFLERDIPAIIVGAFGLVVSLGALLWLAPFIGMTCLALLVPVTVLNLRLAKRSKRSMRRLNNRLENEVAVLQQGRRLAVSRHLGVVAQWRVRLSDDEARTFGVTELFVICLFGIALWQISLSSTVQAGTIYTVFAYIWRFVTSTDDIPQIVQQAQNLKDISARLDGTFVANS
tara:strand:+ start:13964 stop:14752 length:789 start_codon:yes stop_codon:yes gene_type:complete